MSTQASERTKRKPRIAYLLKMYPRFSQTFIVNEMLELERQGLDLHILSLRKPTDGVFHESVSRVQAQADYLPESVSGQLTPIWRTQWACGKGAKTAYGRVLGELLRNRDLRWFELAQAGLLIRWSHKNRIDHLHVHFGTTEATVAWLARLLGGPSYSLTLHAFDIFRDNVNKELLARKINGSRFTITVCESNRRYMVSELPDVAGERIRVNYNGVDLERFVPNGQARDGSVFAVGRLIEKKGFVHLVRAVRQLRDAGLPVHCRIAGEGPERDRLRDEIKAADLKGQVELVGALTQEQVRERMQHASCFVLPCVRAHDGNIDALPTVLLESLACGCPSISTRLSGVPEIIEDRKSGRLVDPGDDYALASAIRDVLTEAAQAAGLSLAGRRRAAERFDVRRNVRVQHDWLLEAALHGTDNSPSGDKQSSLPLGCDEPLAEAP